MLIHSHGPRDTADAFLFLAGGAGGFLLVALLGGPRDAGEGAPAPRDPRVAGATSAFAAAASLGLGALIAETITGRSHRRGRGGGVERGPIGCLHDHERP